MAHIRIGKRPGSLTRDQQQSFEEGRKKITHERVNRLEIGSEKRMRQMHTKDIEMGRANKPGESFQLYQDICIADGCINRKAPKAAPCKCHNKKCRSKSLYKTV